MCIDLDLRPQTAISRHTAIYALQYANLFISPKSYMQTIPDQANPVPKRPESRKEETIDPRKAIKFIEGSMIA